MDRVTSRLHERLTRQSGEAPDGQAVAEAAKQLWSDIHTQLAPLIGSGGVFAIYRRSLFLERNQHMCLAKAFDGASEGEGFSALHQALAGESREWALLAHRALLTNFYAHLVRLIGDSLAERVLTPIASSSSGGDPAPTIQP